MATALEEKLAKKRTKEPTPIEERLRRRVQEEEAREEAVEERIVPRRAQEEEALEETEEAQESMGRELGKETAVEGERLSEAEKLGQELTATDLKLKKLQIEEAQRARQAEMDKLHEEALREDEERTMFDEAKKEDAERTSYNKSVLGSTLNRFGKGKYQRQDNKAKEEKQGKEKGGSPIDPTKMPSSSGEKAKTDGMTYFVIIAAAVIWLIDRLDFSGAQFPLNLYFWAKQVDLSFLGGRYVGFNFDFFGVMRTNLTAVATTTFVAVALMAQTVYSILKIGRRWIALISFLSAMAVFYIWQEGWYEIPVLYGNIIFGVLILTIFYVSYKHPEVMGDYGSYIFMIFFFSFFWINWGWFYDIKARIHVLYILFFGIIYLGNKLNDNPFAWHVITPALMFVDLYGYNLSQGYELFKYIPILIISVTLICWLVNPRTWFSPLALSLVVLFVFAVTAAGAQTTSEQYQGTLRFDKPDAAAASLKETISKIWSGWTGGIETRIDYATGGLYRSQVEKNQFEPLGVNLDRVRAAQPRFYADEKVIVWGTINSRTLSDPVVVKFSCNRWDKEKPVPLESNDKLTPDAPFVVYTLEEKDVECVFGEKKFNAGSNTVTLKATHNFATSAYKKTYFIDNDRLRAMTKESLDPLKEYGKTDAKPKTFFTNGPVDIEIVLTNIVPVSNTPDVKPLLGIKLTNRDKITDKQLKVIGQWQGKIQKINELAVVLPDTIELEETSCLPVPFKLYTIENCKETCKDVCKKSCDAFSDEPDKAAKVKKCADRCSQDETTRCDEDCDALFKSELTDVVYKGYQVDTSKLINFKDYQDIDRYRDFACRINPSPAILTEPVTERFIRVIARYNYELQKSFAVQISPKPELPSEQALISDLYSIYTYTTLVNKHINPSGHPSNPSEVTYSPFILEKAKEQGFDYLLIKSLIQKENPAWNEKDAHPDTNKQMVYGLMQVTEGTGSEICDKDFPNWRKEPEANIQCGIKVLKSKCNEFNPPCLKPKPQCTSHSNCVHPFGLKKQRCQKNGVKYDCRAECREGICAYEFTGAREEKWYSGENAALRAYNGWGVAVGVGTEGYVEEVMKYYEILRKQLAKSGP